MEQRVTFSELDLPETVLVTQHAALTAWVESFLRHPELPLAFDIETTGLDPRTGHIVSLQFYQEGCPVVVVDVREREPYDREYTAEALKPLFTGRLLILGHNLKFDFGWLMQHYGIYPTRCYDSFLAEQVIHGVGRSEAKASGVPLGLAALAQHYAGKGMSKAERNWFIDLEQRPEEWDAALPEEQVAYAAEDVRVLPVIYREQVEQLTTLGLLRPARLEMDALPAITSIEQSGVKVNVGGWRAFIAEKEAEAKRIEEEALKVFGAAILQARVSKYDEALTRYQEWEQALDRQTEYARTTWETMGEGMGEAWGKYKTRLLKAWREAHPNPGKPKPDTSLPNLSSPAQLMQAFLQMGITTVSTASDALKELEEEYPEVKLLLDYRRAEKFVTSFGEALLQYVTPEGRIHPEYVQIGASTGRMSCTRP